MGRKRKKKSEFKDLLADNGSCRFGTVFYGMVISPAYKKLTIGAKHFFTLCRIEAFSINGKACLYKHFIEDGKDIQDVKENYFVFPASHMEQYGIKRENGHRYLKQLIEGGFIDVVENNKHRKKVNVYRFSKQWQHEKTDSE